MSALHWDDAVEAAGSKLWLFYLLFHKVFWRCCVPETLPAAVNQSACKWHGFKLIWAALCNDIPSFKFLKGIFWSCLEVYLQIHLRLGRFCFSETIKRTSQLFMGWQQAEGDCWCQYHMDSQDGFWSVIRCRMWISGDWSQSTLALHSSGCGAAPVVVKLLGFEKF